MKIKLINRINIKTRFPSDNHYETMDYFHICNIAINNRLYNAITAYIPFYLL